jgi:uncharacterized protein YcbK (DUF882 family)
MYHTAAQVFPLLHSANGLSSVKLLKMSEHFTWREALGNIRQVEVKEVTLVMLETAQKFCTDVLQPLREEYGALKITSWIRPPSYNARVSKATASRHLTGDAVDFIPLETSIFKVYNAVNKTHPGGLAMRKRGGMFIHIDGRPYKARWDY